MKARTGYRTRRQAGLGLVEIMIAVTIALFLLAGIYTLFLNTKATYNTQQALSTLQENARYTIETLSRKIRMAGYRGCGGINPKNAVNTLNNAGTYAYDFSVGVQGFDAQSGGTWSPSLPTYFSSLAHPPLAGSDVVTVRTVGGSGVALEAPMPDSSAELKVNSVYASNIQLGDVVMLSDCVNAAILQITQIQYSNHLQHQTGTYSPGNYTKNLGKPYQAGATVQKLASTSYFVANANGSSDCSDGACGLWEKVGAATEQELVRGVDNMQVLYGVASNPRQAVTSYVTAGAVTDWNRVASVRIALLLSSESSATLQTDSRSFDLLGATLGPFNDRRLYRVFTATIALRNRLP